jgi:hypothetical protein
MCPRCHDKGTVLIYDDFRGLYRAICLCQPDAPQNLAAALMATRKVTS